MRYRFRTLLLVVLALASIITPAAAQDGGYKEAPMLAEKVEAGELPPVEERLPSEPLVVEVVDSIGVYGGTWHMGLRGGSDSALLTRTVAYDGLVRWAPDWSGVVPGVAKSFESNAEGDEFTFHLREGMKWSDGAPFTADDIMFWYEDMFMNESLTPFPYSWLVVNDEPVVVEKIDDYTVKFKFAGPNGLFLLRAATGSGLTFTQHPKHYLSQFHASYADAEELDKMVEENEYETWDQLYWNRAGDWGNPEKPVLYAWHTVQPYSGTNVNVILERNPYYWKVDAEGNQLPYIDTVALDVGDDVDTLTLRALNGEIDMQSRHIATLENKAVFYDNMEAGEYDFFEVIPAGNNAMAISLNWTYDDPALREVFRNKDFRIGLSYAIDRQEIIDTVLLGQGIPYQIAPRPESEFYDEEFATQYTEYNVELANEHLDKAFPEKDADGFRLGPDGERISFVFEVMAIGQSWLDMMELISSYWAEVGVDIQIKAIDRSILTDHKDNNLHQATVWGGEGGIGGDLWLDPYWYFPMYFGSNYAVTWWWYYVGDTRLPEGEMPSEAALRQMELYDMIKATTDTEEQAEYMRELLQIAKEEFYVMGIALPGDGYGIVRNNFHNVPESMPASWQYVNPGPTNTCQYYIDPQE